MQPLQTTDFLAIWQHDGLSHVTGSHQAKQQSQSSMAKLQDPLPNASFRLMRCDALLGRPCHIGFQVVQGELQFIMVAIATGLRHVLHHAAPLVRGVYPCFLPHFDIGKPIFPYLIALSLCISQGDAQIADESGRPVTPIARCQKIIQISWTTSAALLSVPWRESLAMRPRPWRIATRCP